MLEQRCRRGTNIYIALILFPEFYKWTTQKKIKSRVVGRGGQGGFRDIL